MLQKSSVLIPADKCGVLTTKIFHVYKGSFKKIAKVGDFTKVSVKSTKPSHWKLKKSKHKAILVRLKKESLRKDGTWVKFFINEGVVLKKRTTPLGQEVYGPCTYDIRRRRFLKSFSGII